MTFIGYYWAKFIFFSTLFGGYRRTQTQYIFFSSIYILEEDHLTQLDIYIFRRKNKLESFKKSKVEIKFTILLDASREISDL